MVKTVNALRYITPLREGGSLPAIVEADDGEMYVIKFSGAGQGVKALIAELISGEVARLLGLNVPEIVLIELDPVIGRSEPNSEIQDLLQASTGLNFGLCYLPQAFAFNLLLQPPPASSLASRIVWFDAYVTNVDRTPNNVNLLVWQQGLWLIDHGASLYFHHDWADYLKRSQTPFNHIKNHTLLYFAADLAQADASLRPQLTESALQSIISQIPDIWLSGEDQFAGPQAHREAYLAYLLQRLEAAPAFVEEAQRARNRLV